MSAKKVEEKKISSPAGIKTSIDLKSSLGQKKEWDHKAELLSILYRDKTEDMLELSSNEGEPS